MRKFTSRNPALILNPQPPTSLKIHHLSQKPCLTPRHPTFKNEADSFYTATLAKSDSKNSVLSALTCGGTDVKQKSLRTVAYNKYNPYCLNQTTTTTPAGSANSEENIQVVARLRPMNATVCLFPLFSLTPH